MSKIVIRTKAGVLPSDKADFHELIKEGCEIKFINDIGYVAYKYTVKWDDEIKRVKAYDKQYNQIEPPILEYAIRGWLNNEENAIVYIKDSEE